jgi:hypothetical protein
MTRPEEDATGRRRPRFTLRALMGMILACAMVLGWFRWQRMSLDYLWQIALYSMAGWMIGLPATFALVRLYGPTVRTRGGMVIVRASFILALAVALLSMWCRYCATYGLVDLRNYPFPDRALIALERWYDARHPLKTPGNFKMHGEWTRVAILMNTLANVSLAATGFLLGLLLKPSARSRGRHLQISRCEPSEGAIDAS